MTDRYVSLGVDQIGVGGDFAGNRLLISPKLYKSFIAPELRKVTDRIHAHGCHAVNASDGHLWEVIEDYLITSGVDGCIEIDERAGMDLRLLKQRYGHRITFYGIMDCGEVLSFASLQEIREQTVRCIEDGGGSGGHIFCASNAIMGSVPVENYLAMVNTYRGYFGLSPVRAEG